MKKWDQFRAACLHPYKLNLSWMYFLRSWCLGSGCCWRWLVSSRYQPCGICIKIGSLRSGSIYAVIGSYGFDLDPITRSKIFKFEFRFDELFHVLWFKHGEIHKLGEMIYPKGAISIHLVYRTTTGCHSFSRSTCFKAVRADSITIWCMVLGNVSWGRFVALFVRLSKLVCSTHWVRLRS